MSSKHPVFEFRPVDSCILCGTTARHPIKGVSFGGVAFSYSICQRCGLKYMDPAPTPASMDRFFKEDYWQQNLNATGFPTNEGYDDKAVDQLASRLPKYRRGFETVRDHVTSLMSLDATTRVLEVGCAFGYSLEWLQRDFGCVADGIEPSDAAIARCKEGGVSIVARSAEEFFCGAKDVPSQKRYDVIFFRHVLETLLDPRDVLRGVREHLKETGVLIVYSPNVEYYDLMSPFTPYCYSPETISRLFQVCGLDAFRVEAPPSPKDRATALRVRPRYELAAFGRRAVPRPVEHPTVDPLEVAKTIQRGAMARAWSHLFASDLLTLLANKVARRAHVSS